MIAHHRSYFTEFKNIISLAWPLMLTHFLRLINPMLSIIICGHLSREELDAASLANTVINVLGFSIDMGFSTASETLFCHTYGSKQRKLMGTLLQQNIAIMTMIFLFLACIHVNIEPILLYFGQSVLISSLAAEYIIFFLPGLFFDFIFMALARYLESQNRVKPMVIAAGIGIIFTLFAQFIFVAKLSMGLRASAGFLSVSFGIMLFSEIIYILYHRLHVATWDGFDFASAMSNWGVFFKLGIPGVLMIALEEWCLEISTFVAGTMGDEVLGAQAITFQIQAILYMVHLGISTAVNVRVGRGLGAFDPQASRHTYHTALITTVGVALTIVTPVVCMRHIVPFLFTTDVEIANICTSLLPILIIFELFEGLASVSEAVLLACGRQTLGACVIFFGYYALGLPLSFFFTYKLNYGIFGMWIGLSVGLGLTAMLYTFFAIKTNWVQQSKKALSNVQRHSELNNELVILKHQVTVAGEPDNSKSALERMSPAEIEFRNGTFKSPFSPMRRFNRCRVTMKIAFYLLLMCTFISSLIYRIGIQESRWHLSCRDTVRNSSQQLPSYCSADYYLHKSPPHVPSS